MTSYSTYFNVYTYRDPLLYFKVESYDNWMHRALVVRKDFFIKKFINGLDVAIFQETPIFVPDILHSKEDLENPEKETPETEGPTVLDKVELEPFDNGDVLKDWNRENWKDLCIRLWDAARTHKWCVVQLYNGYPWWRVFTYREIYEIIYDDNDIPIKAHCMWTKQLPKAHDYNFHDEWINLVEANEEDIGVDGEINSLGLFINWGHDIDERINGNDLESVWSLSVNLRYILRDIISNSAKSSGFYWVTYGSGVVDAVKEDIVNAFETCGSSHIIGATKQVIDDMQAMYPPNPEFAVLAMDKVMKMFSGATGLPYLFYNGEKDTSGVFEENSSALAQVNDKKREVFGQLKHYLLKLVEMRWGIKCDDVFPNIVEVEGESFEEDVIEKRSPSGNGGVESELRKTRLQS